MWRIELLGWDAARARAEPIRTVVFVQEQRVPQEIEMDALDAHCLHAIASAPQGEAVGTGRLLPPEAAPGGPVGHIGRMAVLRARRGQGVGAALLRALMDAARARGDAQIVLSAQVHAIGFYRAHGFVEEGEEYLDAGIAHRQMRRRLGAAGQAAQGKA